MKVCGFKLGRAWQVRSYGTVDHSGFPSLKNLYIEFTVFSGSLFGYDIFVISVNVNLHVNVNVKISVFLP